MSHVDIIDIDIKSLEALEKATERLGGTMMKGKKTYAWFGYSVGDHPIPKGFTAKDLGKCDHALKFPKCKYEVGVVQNKEDPDTYTMLGDFWSSGGLSNCVGQGGWKLKQAYTMEQTAEVAFSKAKVYEEETLPDRKRMTVYLN